MFQSGRKEEQKSDSSSIGQGETARLQGKGLPEWDDINQVLFTTPYWLRTQWLLFEVLGNRSLNQLYRFV